MSQNAIRGPHHMKSLTISRPRAMDIENFR